MEHLMEEALTIAQTSRKFNIPSSTLRYYEAIGLMDAVDKDESGHRIYKEKDFRRINFIKTLRQAGITIEQIKTYVDLFHDGEHTILRRKQILIDQLEVLRRHAQDLNRVILELENVIDNYEDTLMKRELEQRRKLMEKESSKQQ